MSLHADALNQLPRGCVLALRVLPAEASTAASNPNQSRGPAGVYRRGGSSAGGCAVINLDIGAQYYVLLPAICGLRLDSNNSATADGALPIAAVRLIAVNNTTGHLCFTGTPGVDLFRSIEDAKAAVASSFCASSDAVEMEEVLEFFSFVGGYATDEAMHLAFVTEEASTAPGGDSAAADDAATTTPASLARRGLLKRVTAISWINFALRVPASTLALQLEELNFNYSSTPTSVTPSPAAATAAASKQQTQQHNHRAGGRSAARFMGGGSSSAFSSDHLHHHHQQLHFRDMANGILAGDMNRGARKHYFFYSRVCDAANCRSLAAAVAISTCDGSEASLPGGSGFPLFQPVWALLQPEHSIAATEFLWNVELIRFCEFFGLGDCCSRLCVGSVHGGALPAAAAVGQEHASSGTANGEAVWVCRLSRFALSPPSSTSSRGSYMPAASPGQDRRPPARSSGQTASAADLMAGLQQSQQQLSPHDDWQHSPLEAEGQLFLIEPARAAAGTATATAASDGDDGLREAATSPPAAGHALPPPPRRSVRSMIVRRGGDFSRHPDVISFSNMAALSAKDFAYRPLPSAFVAEYWKSMLQRYGDGSIVDVVVPGVGAPSSTMRSRSEAFSIPPTLPGSVRATASPAESPRRDSAASKPRHTDPSMPSTSAPIAEQQQQQRTPPLLSQKPLQQIGGSAKTPPPPTGASNPIMRFLAAAGLAQSFPRNQFFQRVRECFLPQVATSPSPPAATTRSRNRRDARAEDDHQRATVTFRVLADDDRDATATVVTSCAMALVWAAVEESLARGVPCPIAAGHVVAVWHALVPLFLQSSWSPIPAEHHAAVAQVLLPHAMHALQLLTSQDAVVDDPSQPLVPLVRRRAQTLQRDTADVLTVLGALVGTVAATAAVTADPGITVTPFLEEVAVQGLLRSVLSDPRRCNAAFALRPMLLSHPGTGAVIIRSLLLLSAEDSEQPATRSEPIYIVPQSPTSTNGAAAAAYPPQPKDVLSSVASVTSAASSSAAELQQQQPVAPWALVKDLCHPKLDPLLLPEGTEGINFTISLASVSVLTHIGLLVQSASQSGAPFSAALSLSLTVGEYIGPAFGRVVLQETPLPIALGNADGSPSLVLIPLIFTVHQSVSTVLPYRYEDDAPVVGRFVKVALRGSGKIPLMVSPISLFGFPLAKAPELLTRHVQTLALAALMPDDASTARSGGGGRIGAASVRQHMDLSAAVDNVNAGIRNGGIDAVQATFGETSRIVANVLLDRLEAWPAASVGDSVVVPSGRSPTTEGPPSKALPSSAYWNWKDRSEATGHNDAFSAELSSTLLHPSRGNDATLHNVVSAEYTRLRHRVSRRSRDRCYSKLQKLLWLLNPVCAVFPTPMTSAAMQARKAHAGHDGKRCFKCASRMMFLTTKVECSRCYHIFCQRCIAAQPTQVLEHGLREATASVCFACQQLISNLQRLVNGTMVSNEKSWHQFHPDCRILLPFLHASCAIVPNPTIYESVCGVTAAGLAAGTADAYNLCIGDMCQVVACPNLDLVRDYTPPQYVSFEKVLGGTAPANSGGWNILSTSTTTAASSGSPARPMPPPPAPPVVDTTVQVLLRLSAHAVVQRWELSYTFATLPAPAAGAGAAAAAGGQQQHPPPPPHGPVTLHVMGGAHMLQLDTPLQTATLRPTAVPLRTVQRTVGDAAADDGAAPSAPPAVQIVALRFRGALADLAAVSLQHFSLWGCYVGGGASRLPWVPRQPFDQANFHRVPNTVPPSQKRYAAVDFIHFARHAVNNPMHSTYFSGPSSSNSGSGGGGGVTPASALVHTKALPLELPGARLIQVKNALPATACTGSFVMEYELSTPMTLCGFVLENCYAAYMPLTSTNRLATVLRFVGTSSTGVQDNMGVFRLPVVLVHNGEHINDAPPPAIAFAFATSNHTLVSVMVEVLEWRHVPNSCSSPNPPPHYGKLYFWTSPTVKSRRVVSCASFFSAHSSVAESTVVVTKKKGQGVGMLRSAV